MRTSLLAPLGCFLAFTSSVYSAILPNVAEAESMGLVPRQQATSTRVADAQCTHGPRNRACWRDGYSIATDFDAKSPPAGKTVEHFLEITNTTLAPDGFRRLVMAVNGQTPGPTLYADWGDTMVITVKNSLQDNGTSIHWHGLRMLNSCQHDGVNGVTECPIAPGETKVYRFKCTQFGTSWYHSHFSAQYGDGVVGAIVIDGPATSNYDDDMGTMTLTDWYYDTVFALNIRAMHTVGPPPIAQNALINGTMKSAHGGAYHVTKVKKGRKVRIRLINTSIDNPFHVTIDNHNFTVITSDFVPIKPFVTNTVSINIGQRYDIIVSCDQAVGNYWLRADVSAQCSRNANQGNIRSVIRYDGAPETDPTSTGIVQSTGCYDESVTPYVGNQVPQDQFASAIRKIDMDFNVGASVNGPLVQWLINGSDIRVDWSNPTLQYVKDNNYTFEKKMNVFEINQVNTWTFWVIQTVQGDPVNIPHPIHLHGHDFYVLGSGPGVYDGSTTGLKFSNPMRRDTAMLPAGGYLILGFPADNPGVWLMHCHIAFHVGGGFSLQFLERKDEIIDTIGDLGGFSSGCDSWKKYWNGPNRVYQMDDSGL
ncbi:laccase, multicopper oxidase, benzenediol:oxygen oxidorectuctase [Elasticomyces elasticus]|nr:laccase, multicopper oxidase, benzenediol:oxygen oxidorectuctase [Elasticomyces elasticus]